MKTNGSINSNTWKQNALFLAPNITCISLFLWSWTLQSYQINWSLYQLYSSFLSKEKCNCLSHVVMVTLDVRDRDVSTAYCQSSSSPEFTTMNNHNLFYCFCRLRILSTFPWLTLSCVWRQMLISNSHAILALSERDKNILNTSVKSESYS